MNETMLSTSQVASRLKVTTRSIKRYCERGVFPNAFKNGPFINSEWMIPLKDVEDYEDNFRRPPAN